MAANRRRPGRRQSDKNNASNKPTGVGSRLVKVSVTWKICIAAF